MLHLQYSTPAAWAEAALADPVALLLDHRACESEAAAMAGAIARKHGSRAPSIRPGGHPTHAYVCDLRARVCAARGGAPLDQLLIAGTLARLAEITAIEAEVIVARPWGPRVH